MQHACGNSEKERHPFSLTGLARKFELKISSDGDEMFLGLRIRKETCGRIHLGYDYKTLLEDTGLEMANARRIPCECQNIPDFEDEDEPLDPKAHNHFRVNVGVL